MAYIKNSHHTLIALLHYFMKCTIHYYCIVNHVLCRTKWSADTASVHRHSEHINDRHVIHDAAGINVGAVLSGDISCVACSRNQCCGLVCVMALSYWKIKNSASNFSNVCISQSNVATRLRCGGNFLHKFDTYCWIIYLAVKEFWISAKNWQSYQQNSTLSFFTDSVVSVPSVSCN